MKLETIGYNMKLETMDTRALLKLMERINSEIERKRTSMERELHALQKVDLRDPVMKRSRGGSHLKGTKVPPKYRGPKGDTWSGRGAVPRWMRALMKTGKRREAFLIKPH